MAEIQSAVLATNPGQAIAIELDEPDTSADVWTVYLEGQRGDQWVSLARPIVTRAPAPGPGRRLVALGLVPGFSAYRGRAVTGGNPTAVLRLQGWTGVVPGGATSGLLNLDDPPSNVPPVYVVTFNGRSGVVSPQNGDYTAAQVGADPAGSAAAVQVAILTTKGQPGGIAALDGGSQITDATHGPRAGGTLHAAATTVAAGFMSAADKEKLDGIPDDTAGTGWLYGLGLDGARVIAGVAAALTAPVNYTDLTLQAGGVLPALAQPVDVSGTLTIGAGASIHANGNNAPGGTTGGAATAAGSLAQAGIAGAGGGVGNSAGGNASAQGTASTALGGNGGAGGGGNGGQPGGAGGVCVRPVAATVGRWDQAAGIFFNYTNSTFTRPRGGSNGGGGGGSVNGSGGGGGSPGTVQQVRARRIVLLPGSEGCFSAQGGDGAPALVALSGGGGGGGGGAYDVFCDEWIAPDGTEYADFFDVSGGVGGAAVTPGNQGVNGDPGRSRLFIRGTLVYQG